MTVQIFMAISKYRFNCRSNNRTNMELNSANKNPSHDSFIVCIDKQAYKLSLQITKNVKNSEKLKRYRACKDTETRTKPGDSVIFVVL